MTFVASHDFFGIHFEAIVAIGLAIAGGISTAVTVLWHRISDIRQNQTDIAYLKEAIIRVESKIDKAESDHSTLRTAVQESREEIAGIREKVGVMYDLERKRSK